MLDIIFSRDRSSRRRCSINQAVFKNFAIFKGKHLCWSLFFIKRFKKRLQHTCEYCEIFKSTYLEEHSRMAASVKIKIFILQIYKRQIPGKKISSKKNNTQVVNQKSGKLWKVKKMERNQKQPPEVFCKKRRS